MQVNRLKTGDIYRNYGHLCEILEIKPTKKANNQRKAQFKELERYVKWHREGHKIIIDEVYSVGIAGVYLLLEFWYGNF